MKFTTDSSPQPWLNLSYCMSKDLSPFGRYSPTTDQHLLFLKMHKIVLKASTGLFFSKLIVVIFIGHNTVCCHSMKCSHCGTQTRSEALVPGRAHVHLLQPLAAVFRLHVKLSVYCSSANKTGVLQSNVVSRRDSIL